ncbi:MAG: DUF721 domain-containing protein [Desulfobulbaceae bacterium]|nr:DUF721 domain-containing protein [Desulfobulbaceae bacterium]
MKHLTALQHILPDLFKERQWQQPWQVQSLYAQWPDIAGPEAGRSSLPVAIRNQTLWLYVSHSIWAQEIHYRQSELLKRVRPLVPDQDIRAIRCQVDPSFFEQPRQAQTGRTVADIPRGTDAPAPNAPYSAGFDAIVDPDCREALRRLWQALYK